MHEWEESQIYDWERGPKQPIKCSGENGVLRDDFNLWRVMGTKSAHLGSDDCVCTVSAVSLMRSLAPESPWRSYEIDVGDGELQVSTEGRSGSSSRPDESMASLSDAMVDSLGEEDCARGTTYRTELRSRDKTTRVHIVPTASSWSPSAVKSLIEDFRVFDKPPQFASGVWLYMSKWVDLERKDKELRGVGGRLPERDDSEEGAWSIFMHRKRVWCCIIGLKGDLEVINAIALEVNVKDQIIYMDVERRDEESGSHGLNDMSYAFGVGSREVEAYGDGRMNGTLSWRNGSYWN
ncbi:unnamed protein product [Linum trigynum]|uniref:Uncharacterized protein n=1 Tax=Linum trigynum TaxID=586398 RepID=A0AAV2GIL0_9ROSI